MPDETASTEDPKPADDPNAIEQAPIQIDWSTEGAPLYANVLDVASHGHADMFSLAFAEVTPAATRVFTTADGARRFLRARVVASIRVGATVLFPFTSGLARHWNRWASSVQVPPGAPPLPKFKLLYVPREQQLDGLTDQERSYDGQ